MLKHLKALALTLGGAFILSAVLCLILSLMPTTIFSWQLHRTLVSINTYLISYGWLVLVTVGLILLIPKMLSSIERYCYESKLVRMRSIFLATGLVLLLVARSIDESHKIIGNHPLRYFYTSVTLLVIGLWLFYCARVKKSAELPVGVLQPDTALDGLDKLTPEQNEIYEGLLKVLKNEQQIKAIGVFGAWGSGKTTIVDLVGAELENDEAVIWSKFEPWRYTSQEAMTLGFYEKIGSAVDSHLVGTNMSKSVLGQIAHGLVSKNDKTGILSALEPLQYQLAKRDPESYLSDLLERENKRLVVVMDDVERMYDPENIFRTLQLAHYLKSSKRITYIFIAEKDKLLRTAPEHQGVRTGEYLEKFVEFEFNVPSPQQDTLRDYINKLLKSRESYFKIDFNLEASAALIQDSATHRGVLRTFNKFIFDLNEKFFINGEYIVNLTDKYILDHFSVKYPQLWLHIQEHRKLYVHSFRDEDWSIRRAFGDEKAMQQEDAKLISSVLDTIDEPNRTLVSELLGSIFPFVKLALDQGSQHERYETWLKEKRVAHPDILDLYFATSEPYKEYQGILKNLQDLSTKLAAARTLRAKVEIFKDFLNENKIQKDTDYLVFLKRDVINDSSAKSQSYAKALLRAYIANVDYLSRQEDGGVLLRILSIIDGLGSSVRHEQDKLDRMYANIFQAVLSTKPHPSVLLRILLYLEPSRDNSFFNLHAWSGYADFRARSLSYIDKFYLTQDNNLFEERRDKEWRFIFYQWALSVNAAQDKTTRNRKNKANEYLFGLLHDDTFAYEMLVEGFWGIQWSSETEEHWVVGDGALAPYDHEKLEALVDRLLSSTNLKKQQKERLRKLKEILEKMSNDSDETNSES